MTMLAEDRRAILFGSLQRRLQKWASAEPTELLSVAQPCAFDLILQFLICYDSSARVIGDGERKCGL